MRTAVDRVSGYESGNRKEPDPLRSRSEDAHQDLF